MAEISQDRTTQENISRIKEVAWGLVSTAAVMTAVRLRIAETLDSAPRSREEIAREVNADPMAVGQLMDALVARDVFTLDSDGRYRNNELSLLLREDDPHSVSYLVQWIADPTFWKLWPHLIDAVRDGKPTSRDVLGKDFFQYVHTETPESVPIFNRAMTQASRHTSDKVAEALPIPETGTVADVGGGQGFLLRTILDQNPSTQGILLELEGVAAQALPELRPGGRLADRATVVPGDCRAEIPVQADLYVFKNILDWDDDTTVETLLNATEVAKPGAKIAIVETVTDRTPEPRVTSSLDLLLLLNVGGRKHSSDEVANLFERSGIEFTAVHPTETFLTVVEGRVPA